MLQFLVKSKEGGYGLISTKGEVIVPLVAERYSMSPYSDEGLYQLDGRKYNVKGIEIKE